MAIDKEFNTFEEKINSLYPLLKIANQQSKKQIFMQIIDACRPIDLVNLTDRLLITNNYLKPNVLEEIQYQKFPNSWYGIYSGKLAIETTTPSRAFNCFMNRMDPIRQSWLYQLIRHDLFDHGYISFNMGLVNIETNLSAHELFESQFQSTMQIFEVEHAKIKNQLPYRNFDSTKSLSQIIMDSKFSIVLETFFDRNDIITFSEKIFRCLKLPRPWLLFSSQSAVAYLRDIGFDVLDDIVDHSYDNIAFAINRQSSLLTQATELINSLEFTTSIQSRLYQAANHNQQLIEKFSDAWHRDVAETFQQAISKANL